LFVPSATEEGKEPAVNALEDVVLQEDGQNIAHNGTQPLKEQVCVNMS